MCAAARSEPSLEHHTFITRVSRSDAHTYRRCAQHFLRRYRDALRDVCCENSATQQRLDELLQAMGAAPLVSRRGRLLPRGAVEEHEARATEREREACAAAQAGRLPRWARILLARLRSPLAIDEQVAPEPRAENNV